MGDSLTDAVDAVLAAATDVAPDECRPRLVEAATQLHGPLRVAIVGKVKAGKSTLLNALVGERVAPTDASECTRVVTRYRSSHRYRISAVTADAEIELDFDRADGQLTFDLGELALEAVRFVDVEWPTSRLRDLVLIDTPGLASASRDASVRTEDFLITGTGTVGADAVIYLMRHLHPMDLSFLEAFSDGMASRWASVNSIGVLSRADEVGACRLHAMATARRIAERYQADERVRSLCQIVTPVAGLLASSAPTFDERALRTVSKLVAHDADDATAQLLSAERFVAGGSLDEREERRHLLARVGLFGARVAYELLSSGQVHTAGEMSMALERESGIDGLRSLLTGRFTSRARVLQARSALAAVGEVASIVGGSEGRQLRDRVLDVEHTVHELTEIHILAELATHDHGLRAEAGNARRLLGSDGPEPTARLGLPASSDTDAVRRAALASIAHWQGIAEDPLIPTSARHVARAVVRTCEGMAFASSATR